MKYLCRKYSIETVTIIATKLKSKGSINVGELLVLMYALSEREDHISSFFQVHGAVQGLVKELTGMYQRICNTITHICKVIQPSKLIYRYRCTQATHSHWLYMQPCTRSDEELSLLG